MALSNSRTPRVRWVGFFLLTNFSLALAQAQHLPQEVLVKTPTQTIDSEFEYVISEGKLYYRNRAESFLTGTRKWTLPFIPRTTDRPNPKMPAIPETNDWQLFQGDGLPDSTHHLSQSKLVKVMADADEVAVFDEQGRGWWFRHRTSYLKWPMGQWLDSYGQPVDVPFVIPSEYWPAPAIALGRRNEDVKYFEDAQGHEHHWGTFPISSHYVLSKDRRHIYLLDPGIPLDFRYELCPPWKGQKKISALDASGATMMAMDEDGMVLTRLEDFDTNGMDSMLFLYSYDGPNKNGKSPDGQSPKSRWAPYHLNRKDQWQHHAWNLPSGAKISTTISIFTTGQGNASRLLRVYGINELGQHGVFQKMLSDSQWSFLPSAEHLPISDDQFFEPKSQIPNGTNFATKNFSGQIKWKDQDYTIEVTDFHQGCTDTTVKITNNNQTYNYQLFHDQAYTQLNLQDYSLPHPYLAMATWRADEAQNIKLQQSDLPKLIEELNSQEKKMFSWRLVLDRTSDKLSLYPGGDPELRFQLNPNEFPPNYPQFVDGTEWDKMLVQLQKKKRLGKFAGHVLSFMPNQKYRYMGKMIPAHFSFYLEAYNFWGEELQADGLMK